MTTEKTITEQVKKESKEKAKKIGLKDGFWNRLHAEEPFLIYGELDGSVMIYNEETTEKCHVL